MNQLFTSPVKALRVIAISSMVMAGSIAAHAQVKVGANPANITSNSVLDVEGTSGQRTVILQNGNMGINQPAPTNKLHVKDATNPVKIEGLQSSTNSADKSIVVDANGVLKTGSNSESSFGTAIYLKLSDNQALTNPRINVLAFNTVVYNSGDFTLSGNEITINKAGTYIVFSQVSFNNVDAGEQLVTGVLNTSNQWIARATHYAAAWAGSAATTNLGECFFSMYPITVTAGQKIKIGAATDKSKGAYALNHEYGDTGSGVPTTCLIQRVSN